MTPEQAEQDIARIKKDYKEHWANLEKHPGVQFWITNKNPIKLGEICATLVHGSYYDRGVAHQVGHPIVAFINYQPKDFDSIESARKYIAYQKSLNPSIHIGLIYKRTKEGGGEGISI